MTPPFYDWSWGPHPLLILLEACRLPVSGTAQARQMHICLHHPMSQSLYVGATSPLGTSLTQCCHFMIRARGLHPLLILLEACHLHCPMSHSLCMQVLLHHSERHQCDTTVLRLELGPHPLPILLEAYRLPVSGTAQAHWMHIRLRRPMSHCLHMLMQRCHFTIGIKGPHPLPTLLEVCHPPVLPGTTRAR